MHISLLIVYINILHNMRLLHMLPDPKFECYGPEENPVGHLTEEAADGEQGSLLGTWSTVGDAKPDLRRKVVHGRHLDKTLR
jgi:hypothetical protein